MTEMIRNNPADVVYNAFSQAFFQGMVKMFQNDNEMATSRVLGGNWWIQRVRSWPNGP